MQQQPQPSGWGSSSNSTSQSSSSSSRKRSFPGSSASQPVFSSTGDSPSSHEGGRMRPPLSTSCNLLQSRRKKGKQSEGGKAAAILEGKGICITGFTLAVTEVIKQEIAVLGGTYNPQLKLTVDYLVAATANSEKYKVVTREWLTACKVQGRLVEDVGPFRLPPFAGLGISTTGITPEERDKLFIKVTSNGGGLLNHMEQYKTTHLIAENCDSLKYKAAKDWGVPVVTSKWIDAMIESKGWVREDQYSPALLSSQQAKSLPKLERFRSGSIIQMEDSSSWQAFMEEEAASRVSALPFTSVLDSSVIYLAGLDDCDKDTKWALIELVRKGTGTRAPRGHHLVTHVVVAHASVLKSGIIDKYFRPPHSDPAIVTKDWLLDTIRTGELQDTSAYPVKTTNTSTNSSTATAAEAASANQATQPISKMTATATATATTTAGDGSETEDEGEEEGHGGCAGDDDESCGGTPTQASTQGDESEEEREEEGGGEGEAEAEARGGEKGQEQEPEVEDMLGDINFGTMAEDDEPSAPPVLPRRRPLKSVYPTNTTTTTTTTTTMPPPGPRRISSLELPLFHPSKKSAKRSAYEANLRTVIDSQSMESQIIGYE